MQVARKFYFSAMFLWLHLLNQSSFEQTNENILINPLYNHDLFFTETDLNYTDLGLLIKMDGMNVLLTKQNKLLIINKKDIYS